ncbi:MAG TPA: STAS domain-containing protein [Thermoleophilaceae bacterium]|nr:STAS domain-containing protein [Thermoleophilaceae bacterium]
MHDFQLLLSEPNAGVLELSLVGEVDLGNVETLREASQTAAGSGDYSCLVFDLTRLAFIDSSGLHALTEARAAMVARGGTTKVVCSHGSLLKVLELTGLTQIFPIVSTRDEAIAVAA